MSERDKEFLGNCWEAVREVSGRLMDEGYSEKNVANALLCELLAFNCDTPDDVERYLDGLLSRFRRNRTSIQASYSQSCH